MKTWRVLLKIDIVFRVVHEYERARDTRRNPHEKSERKTQRRVDCSLRKRFVFMI